MAGETNDTDLGLQVGTIPRFRPAGEPPGLPPPPNEPWPYGALPPGMMWTSLTQRRVEQVGYGQEQLQIDRLGREGWAPVSVQASPFSGSSVILFERGPGFHAMPAPVRRTGHPILAVILGVAMVLAVLVVLGLIWFISFPG